MRRWLRTRPGVAVADESSRRMPHSPREPRRWPRNRSSVDLQTVPSRCRAVTQRSDATWPGRFADGSLLQQIGNEWIPAAGETLHAIEQAFTEEPAVRS